MNDTAEDLNTGTEEGCGYSWDHTLGDGETIDGMTVQECQECGAEIITYEETP